MRRFLFFLLRISISLILISLLFKFIDFQSLIKIISQAKIFYLLFAFILSLFIYILALFRWKMLLSGIGITLTFRRVTLSYLLSLFFNLFLPSTIGGDLVRSLDLAIYTKRKEDVIATVFLDRLSGYFGLVFVCIFSLLFGYRLINFSSVYFSLGIIFIIFLFIISILFNKTIFKKTNSLFGEGSKISRVLKEIHSKIYYFRERPRLLMGNLILSILIQLGGPIICYILTLALGEKLSLIYFLVIVPIIGAITMLPVSIGGLGLRDLSMVFFFSQINITLKDIAFAISLLNFFFIVLIGLLGGVFYVLTFHSRWLQYYKKDTQSFF